MFSCWSNVSGLTLDEHVSLLTKMLGGPAVKALKSLNIFLDRMFGPQLATFGGVLSEEIAHSIIYHHLSQLSVDI